MQYETSIKGSNLYWRIYKLTHSGILKRVGRGLYTIGKEFIYFPNITHSQKVLYNKIKKQFPLINICIWNTKCLNEFMIHQPGRFYQIIEVDKDATESVFYFLREKHTNIFLSPSIDILNRYIADKKEVTIITHLVSEAPIQKINKITTITIEKLLVDIFSDEVLFSAQQGQEMVNIFQTAYEKYTINESKLLRYANRRKKKDAILNFIDNNISRNRH